MWDLSKAFPFGRLSIRNMGLFAAAMLVATFLYTLLVSPTAYAADAEWNGTSIMYQQKEYIKEKEAVKAGDKRGLPVETQVYGYVEPSSSSPSNPTSKAHLIYFAPGTDPTTATTATYVTYDFTPPGTYKNPSGQAAISLSPQSAASKGTTSCIVEGIGWIICPVTNFLAGAMDWLFNILSSFLVVRPVQTNQENALYRAWSFSRNFANVGFLVAFLVIIYSQITSIGLSNHDIKKMLPRLIFSSILVNISYWVCTGAVDFSNILGYSIQDIFISMRSGLVGTEGNGWDLVSWKSISGAVLSGGTATAATAAGVYGLLLSAGTVGGAIFMLLPILVGVLVAVLVALLVMAARQAVITILIILSPLAFVAYLLPNTEKHFKKWHELGMTMLMVFPIFSVVFGGSQLAGIVIIQNADSINTVILGMGVQVAPVIVTPLLVKVSGSLVGRIAGMVNNPSKGLIDRTRGWSEEKRDQRKARKFADPLSRKRDFIPRKARNIDSKRREREGYQKRNEAKRDNLFAGSEIGTRLDEAMREVEREKQTIETQHESSWNVKARLDTASIEKELRLRVALDATNASKTRLDAMHEEFKGGVSPIYGPQTSSMTDLLNRSNDTTRDLALTSMRKQAAERIQKQQLTNDLLQNSQAIDGKTLRDYAGGIAGKVGSESALASAVAEYRKEYMDRIQEKEQLIKHFNLSSKERQTLALGGDVKTDKNGVEYIFAANDDYAREAAIDDQLKTGSFEQIEQIIMESGKVIRDGVEVKGRTSDYATSISQAIAANGIQNKAVYLGAKTIDDIAQGTVYGNESLDTAVRYNIVLGKVKDEVFAGMDAKAIARMVKVANTQESLIPSSELPAFRENRQALRHSAYRILNTDILSQRASTSAKEELRGFAVRPPDAP